MTKELTNLSNHINTIFWIFFILMGASIALMAPIEVIIGLLVILIGLTKLSNEANIKSLATDTQALSEDVREIKEWLHRDHDFISMLREKYDNRIFRSSRKQVELSEKLEKNYRDLTNKILQIDNKLMEVSRAFLTKSPRSGKK